MAVWPQALRRDAKQQTERSYTMGDKGGKKDKHKSQKQKKSKQDQKAKEKRDRQPKSTPIPEN